MKLDRLFTALVISLILIPSAIVLAAGGVLDATFDGDASMPGYPGNGRVVTDFGNSLGDQANDVAIQSTGKIVAAGYASGSHENFALARYNADGTLDTSFGTAFPPFSGGAFVYNFYAGGATHDRANALVINSTTGDIYVAGYAVNTSDSTDDMALMRFDSNGNFLGLIPHDFWGANARANDVALQSTGKVIIAGYTDYNASDQFALVRFNSDLSWDTSFGTSGNATIIDGIYSTNRVQAIAIQPDDKIVAAGYTTTSAEQFTLVRYTSNGTLDSSFSGGKVTTDFALYGGGNARINAVVIQPTGEIVVAGYAHDGFTDKPVLARYDSSGNLDSSFSGGDGSDGIALPVDWGSWVTAGSQFTDLVLQTDGSIVAGGYAYSGSSGSLDFFVTRFDSSGAVDTGFGSSGAVLTDFFASLGNGSQGEDKLMGLALQSDGSIVAAGFANHAPSDPDYDFALARYEGAASPTTWIVDNSGDVDDGDFSPNNFTLREALAEAGAGDTIVFAPTLSGQTIRLNSTLTITQDLTIDGGSNNITISGDTNNDGTPDVQVFNVSSGNVTFDGLTIARGTAANGGGIFVDASAAVTLTNSTLISNTANGGGGLYNTNTTNIINSTFAGNSAVDGAGALSFGTGLMVANSTFSANSATANGGAILGNDGVVAVFNSTFSGNSAGIGAGVAALSSFGTPTVHLQNSIFANHASNDDCDDASGAVTFTGSNNLMTNTFCSGAGTIGTVTNFDGTLADNGGGTQTHALLTGSNAIDAGIGGCLDYNNNPLTTDQRGIARQGAACDIGAFEYVAPPSPSLAIAKTVNPGGIVINGATVTYTIVVNNSGSGDATSVVVNDVFPPEVGGGSIFTFTNITAGGSLDLTIARVVSGTPGSVVTNTASYSYASGFGSDSVAFTIAAAPADTTLEVDTTTDSNAAGFQVCADATPNDCSLRGAISKSNADSSNAYTITVPADTYTLSLSGADEDANATGDLDILGDVTINGAGAMSTTIDANGIDRVMEVYNTGLTVMLNDLTLQNGTISGTGGGLYNNQSTVTINRSAVLSNTSTGNSNGGGGLFNLEGTLTINESLIANNTATGSGTASGAGVFNESFSLTATLNINNSTVSNNTADVYGGGVFNDSLGASIVTIRSSTLSGNSAALSGGGVNDAGNSTSIQNSILTNNSGPGAGYNDCDDNFGAGTFSGSNNLIDDNTSGACSGISSAAVTNFNTTLADNGGETQTYALLSGSNALDAGTGSCPDHSGSPLTSDQRGVTRPQGSTCDIGAFELAVAVPDYTLDVDVTTDSNAAGFQVCDDATPNDCSLRGAISKANADSGNSYTVALLAGTYTLAITGTGEDNNATGDLDISSNITFQGVSSATTIIDAAQIDRILHIPNSGYDVNLQNLTLTGGSADYGGAVYMSSPLTMTGVVITNNVASQQGGGIYNYFAHLTITDSLLSNNSANSAGGFLTNRVGSSVIANSTLSGNYAGWGGGVTSLDNGSSHFQNCDIYNNSAGTMAGVMMGGDSTAFVVENSTIRDNSSGELGGAIASPVSLVITNTVISGNSTGWGYGGAIAHSSSDVIRITDSTISGNTSDGNGGAVSMELGGTGQPYDLTLINTTVSNNSAKKHGGGIAGSSGSVNLINVTMAGNTADSDGSGDGDGGAIYLSGDGVTIITNTLIADNADLTSEGPDCYGTLTSGDYNLLEDVTGCTITGTVTNIITGSDPQLDILADNGGDTETHALITGSPAIDAIPNGVNGCGTTITTDQRGVTRPVGSACDIGAFEGAIAAPNNPPSFTSSPITAATVGVTYTYAISTTDPDGDFRTVSYVAKPDWSTLTPTGIGAANLAGIPGSGDVGPNPVILLVQDSGGLTVTQAFTITVSPAPQPTLAITKSVEPGGAVNNGDTVTYTIVVSNSGPGDAAGVVITDILPAEVSGSDLITTVNVNAGQQATFEIAGAVSGAGGTTVTNTAEFAHASGSGSDSAAFSIAAPPVNNPPSFASSPVTSVDQDQLYSYSIATSDADGDSRAITAPTKPAWLTLTDNGNGTAALSGTPVGGDVGTHPVSLLVTDSGGLTDTQSFTVTVNAAKVDCSGNDLKTRLNGTGVINLDGNCRYLLTDTSGKNGHIIMKNSVSNVTINGNGAVIERDSSAADLGILLWANSDNIIIRDVTFKGGKATSGDSWGARGGAIALYNTDITLSNVRFEDNAAVYGGGLNLYKLSNVTLENVDFDGNTATGNGGALTVRGNNTIIINDSTFINNSATKFGGGVHLPKTTATATIYNTVFAGNKASKDGAALYSFGQVTVENSTIVDNTGNQNPAIWTGGDDGVAATLDIKNSIIANHDRAIIAGQDGTVTEDCNIFSDNNTNTYTIKNGQINNGGNSKSIENLLQRLVDPANHNYRPKENFLDVCATATTSGDADGLPRPFPGSLVDAGAYEFQSFGIPSLSIVKLVDYWISANSPELYELTVSNNGRGDAVNVVISDTLPAGVTYVNSSASDGGSLVNGAVSWNIGTLGAGQSKTVQYQAQASQTVTDDNYLAVSLADSTVSASGQPVLLQVNTNLIAQGFLPNPDGFSFRNYTDIEDSDLTVDDMVSLFGADKVCKTQTPSCVLTAAAGEWRRTALNKMGDGHCSGFAAGSLRIFSNQAVNPGDFQSGAGQTYDLTKPNVRNYIAYYYVTQSLRPVDAQGTQYSPTAYTPVAVLDHLIATFNDPGPIDDYTLAVGYKTFNPATGSYDYTGHEVTPYAVKEITPNDEYWIYVYDNNYPNRFDKVVKIDRSANTWFYDPKYRGTAADQTILLKSLAFREQFPKRCYFCDTGASGAGMGAQANDEPLRFIVDGEANLLVTRNDGKRVGYDPTAAESVNEIAGAIVEFEDMGMGFTAGPIIEIPHVASATYSLQLFNAETGFGNSVVDANVTIVGPNVVVGAEGLIVRTPDEVDEILPDLEGQDISNAAENGLDMMGLAFDPDPDNIKLGFTASQLENKQPTLKMALTNSGGEDYTFKISGMDLNKDKTVEMNFDSTSKTLTFSDDDSSQDQTYDLQVNQITEDGTTNSYQKNDVTSGDGAGAKIDFTGWDGQTDPPVTVVINNNLYYLPVITKNN